MSEAKHTPGPWIVDEYDVITAWTVHDDDYPSEPLHRLIVNDCNYSGWADLAVPLANAHLIAAAPEMYEALKLVADSGKFSCFDDLAWDAVNGAISKAEGRP